jgi:hypothetical protein
MTSEANTITGVVCAVNERGLRLDGEDSWRNFSKWADALGEPARGDRVHLTLDRAGFVRSVAVVTEAAPAEMVPIRTKPTDRDTRITRMACLNTATSILQSRQERGGMDIEEVMALATLLEAWVTR